MLVELGTTCPQRLPVRQRLSGMLEEFVLFNSEHQCLFPAPIRVLNRHLAAVDQPLGKAGGTCVLLCPRALGLRHVLQDRWWFPASQFLL